MVTNSLLTEDLLERQVLMVLDLFYLQPLKYTTNG